MLNFFSEMERTLKLIWHSFHLSFVVARTFNVWPIPFNVYTQTITTCWGLRQCQCLVNGNWSNYTERWAEDISSVKGRFLKACIKRQKKSCIRLRWKYLLVQWILNPIWKWLCIRTQRSRWMMFICPRLFSIANLKHL